MGPPFLIMVNIVSFSTPASAPASAAITLAVSATKKVKVVQKTSFQRWDEV